MRAQANLVALGVALLVVSATVTAGVAIADGAYASAEREPVDRGRAVALADRLVAPASPLTFRDHVLSTTAVANLSAGSLHRAFPATRDWGVRLTLDGERVLAAGTPAGGVSMTRVVLVGVRDATTFRPRLDDGRRITLPRRTRTLTVTLDPPPATTVTAVRVDGRTVLREPAGLRGTYRVAVSRYETVTVSTVEEGTLPPGSVVLVSHPLRVRKATLEVTVDA